MNLINNTLLRCLVIEDEEAPRQIICNALNAMPNVQVVGDTGVESKAYELVVAQSPDAIFLDIELIGGNAFMLLNRLRENNIPIPPIIITTAYPEYGANAINDYHDCIIKYLTKPFFENLNAKLGQCLDAARVHIARKNPESAIAKAEANKPKTVFVRSREQYIKLDLNELAWIKVDGSGGVFLIMDNAEKTVQQVDVSLSKLMDTLSDDFLQISRDFVINVHKIKRIDRSNRSVFMLQSGKETELYIGGTYYDRLRQVVLKEVV